MRIDKLLLSCLRLVWFSIVYGPLLPGRLHPVDDAHATLEAGKQHLWDLLLLAKLIRKLSKHLWRTRLHVSCTEIFAILITIFTLAHAVAYISRLTRLLPTSILSQLQLDKRDSLFHCSTVTMPLSCSTKAPNEHLIFVKNVPGYLATDEIRSLFAKYNPASVKNVYPNSNVTTVVIGFRTKDQAARAQAGTDQTRLAHVVLKVEMYNQRQSVRYLRDQGQVNRPRGAVQEDESEYLDEDPTQEEELGLAPHTEQHAAKDPTAAPQGTTWADVAGNRRAPFNEATTVPEVDSPATTDSTPISTPRMPTAVPQKLFALDLEHKSSPRLPPAAVSLGYSAPETLAIPPPLSSRSTDTSSTDEIEGQVRRLGDITSWTTVAQWASESSGQQPVRFPTEPLDTTARIRAMHCWNCTFCQLRGRS
jgi:hypothetical protein